MALKCELSTGQTLYLENLNGQTQITLMTSSVGQQQQSSSQFATGDWIAPPVVHQIGGGVVVLVKTANGDRTLQIQQGHMGLTSQSSVQASQPLTVQEVPSVPAPSMQPMQPMEPLPPLKMGNMQMSMNPMEMTMGNMQMKMEDVTFSPAAPSPAEQRFCTQCGSPVQLSDRFCAHCGHSLT